MSPRAAVLNNARRRAVYVHCSKIAARELILAGAHSPLVVIFGHFLLGGRACVGVLSVLPTSTLYIAHRWMGHKQSTISNLPGSKPLGSKPLDGHSMHPATTRCRLRPHAQLYTTMVL